jgi:exodeoxyribonuclease V alpha subunit
LSDVVSGTLKKVIFTSGPFAIFSVETEDGSIVAKGEYPDIERDEKLKIEMTGEYVDDRRWGKQFKMASVRSLAQEEDGLFYFLTRIVGHVSAKTARKISDEVEDFDALMATRPGDLKKFKGIGDKTLKKIQESWERFRQAQALGEMLAPHGVSRTMVLRIFEHFGSDSEAIVRRNPYSLTEIDGIGFRRADEVALRMGIRPDSSFRILAGLSFVMDDAAQKSGHTALEREDILLELARVLHLDTPDTQYHLSRERFDDVFPRAVEEGVVVPVGSGGMYAHPRYRHMERYIHDRLTAEARRDPIPLTGDEEAKAFISGIEKKTGFHFSDEQVEAVLFGARGYRVFGIGGYAGCGKTTIALAAIRLIAKYGGNHIACCALSGVAAKRVETVTGFPGFTIHSLLRLGSENEFGPDRKLDHDLIVLDEASMVDTYVFYKLLSAIDFDRTRLIIIGDPGQLPPVGPGAPYTDMLEHHLIPHVLLTRIYRQSEDQALVSMAAQIRRGEVPRELDAAPGEYKDIHVSDHGPGGYWALTRGMGPAEKKTLREGIENATIETIRRFAGGTIKDAWDRLASEGRWAMLTTFFQIAAPMKRGIIGTENINRVVGDEINPPSPDKAEAVAPLSRKVIRDGDRVIHLKNRTKDVLPEGEAWRREERRVFNGQIGFVTRITDDGDIHVLYPNEKYTTIYSIRDVDDGELDRAFALSIHKTQGQEARYFVLAVSRAHTQMLNARLLYTGVTRARNMILIAGEIDAFREGCRTLDETRRTTVIGTIAGGE